MLSGEATNTNFIVFGLNRSGLNPQYTALKASMLTITPPMLTQYQIFLHVNGLPNEKVKTDNTDFIVKEINFNFLCFVSL